MHEGLELRFDGVGHRIPLAALTGGATITVYGQQKVVKDLIDARLAAGGAAALRGRGRHASHDIDTDAPGVRFRHDGAEQELRCDVVAGCDGFHGVCRAAIPDGVLYVYEREYPFAWLGILAEVPPSSRRAHLRHHERGFALHSLRSPSSAASTCSATPDDDLDGVARRAHLGGAARALRDRATAGRLERGPDRREGRSRRCAAFVVEPMQHGRLFLAGDAAHIVPPTGAKGLNLAVADVRVLAEALAEWYDQRRRGGARRLLRATACAGSGA